MRVLLHASETDRDGGRLQIAVQKVFSRKDLEVLRSVEELKASLHIPLGQKALGILMAANVGELRDILLLKNLMKNLAVVLVVPNYKPETLTLAHLLLPRYLEHKGNDFNDLARVLTYLAG
jgi:hypothetical protein